MYTKTLKEWKRKAGLRFIEIVKWGGMASKVSTLRCAICGTDWEMALNEALCRSLPCPACYLASGDDERFEKWARALGFKIVKKALNLWAAGELECLTCGHHQTKRISSVARQIKINRCPRCRDKFAARARAGQAKRREEHHLRREAKAFLQKWSKQFYALAGILNQGKDQHMCQTCGAEWAEPLEEVYMRVSGGGVACRKCETASAEPGKSAGKEEIQVDGRAPEVLDF